MLQREGLGAAAGVLAEQLEAARSGADAGQSALKIQLPADHYAHEGAPTEWWWNIGTLQAGERTFGFEINAVSYAGRGGYGFIQVMVTDVSNERHLQRTTVYPQGVFDPATYAEYDPSKDWFVKIGDPDGGDDVPYVTMNAPAGDPTKNICIKARTTDETTGAVVSFHLNLSQEGLPFLVLGNGIIPIPGASGPPIAANNFYYSLTRLHASGTIVIDDETFEVTGITWMDHEYGAFGSSDKPVKWILQDMQLDNGVCISNFSLTPPDLGKESSSIATIQYQGMPTVVALTTLTPQKPWVSPVTGATYFMELLVNIKRPTDLFPWWPDATLTVTSIVDSQEFPVKGGPVYEGVARVTGVFNGQPVTGRAWNEQTGR